MIYNIHYDVCAIAISMFSIVFALVKKGFRQRQNQILLVLFCMTLLTAFFDVVSAVANSYIEQWSDGARYALNYIYLGLQNIMPYLVCCYVVCVVGLTYRLGRKSETRYFAILSIPWICCILLLVSNPIAHFVFYFDENRVYKHGLGMYILYAIALIYLIYSFVLLIRYGHRAVKSAKIMIMALDTVSVLAVIVQMFYPSMLIQLAVESLCLLGLLVSVDNEAEIVDVVTNCYNKQRFIRDSILGLENEAHYEVIIIKLPNLSSYNASIGVSEVNKVLRSVGTWLRTVNKESEVYYCEGGCFAIICDKSTNSTIIEPILTSRFLDSFVVGKTAIRFRPIISHARAGVDFKTWEQLLILTSTMESNYAGIVSSEKSVRKISDYKKEFIIQHAIERGVQFDEVEVLYQPIWNAHDNQISAAEALLRLYDEADGLIPTEDIINFAERRGYIVELGEAVFENVCRFIGTHDLQKAGLQRIHINLSPFQCVDEMLPQKFEDIREKYNVSLDQIVFEISEGSTFNDFKLVEKTVKSLSDKGYQFALDNYGKGTMDMSYLFDLPFSILKLDKSFLWDAESNLKANIFFAGTMNLAKEMNMKTIAVGVELAAQKTLLQSFKCDYLQGYYFQKPVSAEQFYRYCVGFNSKE